MNIKSEHILSLTKKRYQLTENVDEKKHLNEILKWFIKPIIKKHGGKIVTTYVAYDLATDPDIGYGSDAYKSIVHGSEFDKESPYFDPKGEKKPGTWFNPESMKGAILPAAGITTAALVAKKLYDDAQEEKKRKRK